MSGLKGICKASVRHQASLIYCPKKEKEKATSCLTDTKWQALRSAAHLFPISEISPWHSYLQRISRLWNMPCHMIVILHYTEKSKAPSHSTSSATDPVSLLAQLSKICIPKNKTLLPPSCLQRFVPMARTQTYWWQRKGDVIKRLTTAAHFTAFINMCTWVWDHKCRQESGCWVGGLGHWFWLNLVPIYPWACRVICRHLMGCFVCAVYAA